jgi:hypothetical protein
VELHKVQPAYTRDVKETSTRMYMCTMRFFKVYPMKEGNEHNAYGLPLSDTCAVCICSNR